MPFLIKVVILLIYILFYSCKSPNYQKIEKIENFEMVIVKDDNMLKSINIADLSNMLKIASFNFSQLEMKEIDSISLDLIYFEYRDYLNCVNDINKFIYQQKNLTQKLNFNKHQLTKIKLDYINSNTIRQDLDSHFENEIMITTNTSQKILNLIRLIENKTNEFDSLNRIIEKVIYE